MVVMVPREKWTDDRLDDLNKKVDDGFARLEKKMDDGFTRVDGKIEGGLKELRGEMNSRFSAIDARFDSLQRSLFAATVVIVGAMIGANAF